MSSQALLLVCCSSFPVEATFSIVTFFAILKRVPGNLFYQIARSDSSSNGGDDLVAMNSYVDREDLHSLWRALKVFLSWACLLERMSGGKSEKTRTAQEGGKVKDFFWVRGLGEVGEEKRLF